MTQLSRGLGLWAGIAINVANVIGTGVFLKTRVMTCNVDDPMIVMVVWAGRRHPLPFRCVLLRRTRLDDACGGR